MASQVGQGSTIDSVVHAPRFGIFFKRRASVSIQLRTWDIDALLNAEEKICGAILQTRQHPDLDEALVSRALCPWAATPARGRREVTNWFTSCSSAGA